MSIRNKQKIIEVEIKEWSKKGNGIGYFTREDETVWPVEVSFTIPGDTVRILLLRKRSGVYKSLLEEIITPSKDRIQPRCKHFGVCGGCRWQQISYEAQLEMKETSVRKAFQPLMHENSEFRPIFPCEEPWEYRNKMEFSFSSDAANHKYLGMVMEGGKGRVFHLEECHLPNPWFAECVSIVRGWWKEFGLEAFHPYRNRGSLRTLTLREGQRTGDRMVILTVSGNPDDALTKQHLESFVAFIRHGIEPMDPEKKLSIFLKIHQAIKGKPTSFFEMHLYGPDVIREVLKIRDVGELTFNISPAAFFQPNTRQAEQLYALALEMLPFSKDSVVYDLYCGTGTLGICAARKAKQVIGIELSPEAAIDARANAELNGLSNIVTLAGSVQDKLKEICDEEMYPLPDFVMVDPPRMGLDTSAMQQLIDLAPAKILYISCNPATQVQNVAEFIEAGYRISTIQPVDQFPHTRHIENIVLLEK